MEKLSKVAPAEPASNGRPKARVRVYELSPRQRSKIVNMLVQTPAFQAWADGFCEAADFDLANVEVILDAMRIKERSPQEVEASQPKV